MGKKPTYDVPNEAQQVKDTETPFARFTRQMYGTALTSPTGGSVTPLREQDDDQTHVEYNSSKPLISGNGPQFAAIMDAHPHGGAGFDSQTWPYLLTTLAYANDVPGRVNPTIYDGENYDWSERTRQRTPINVNVRKSLTGTASLSPDGAKRSGSPAEQFVKRMATLFSA